MPDLDPKNDIHEIIAELATPDEVLPEGAPAPNLSIMPRADAPAIFAAFTATYTAKKTEALALVISREDAPEVRAGKAAMAKLLRTETFAATRIAAANKHKELKAGILEEGRKLDAFKNTIEDECKAVEAHLRLQEQFEETERLRLEDEARTARMAQLQPYLRGSYIGPDVGTLTDTEFQRIWGEAKELHELREFQARAQREAAEREEQQRREAEEKQQRELAELQRQQREREEAERQRHQEEAERQRQLAAALNAIRTIRVREVSPFMRRPLVEDVARMTEAEYDEFLAARKKEHHEWELGEQARKDEEAKLQREEEERQAAQRRADEEQRQQVEREREELRRQAEALAEQQRRLAEQEEAQRKIEEQQRREAAEKAEQERLAAVEAERQQRAAAAAPDLEKVTNLYEAMCNYVFPRIENPAASAMLTKIVEDFCGGILGISKQLAGGTI